MHQVRMLSAKVGAQVTTDIDILLGGGIAPEIRRIVHERGVISFGAMNLTDEQHRILAATLGTIGPDYTNQAELDLLLSDAEYEKGAFLWHIDDITEAVPHFGSLMTMRTCAPWGGQTEWANAAIAYEELPEADKALIANLRVVHSFEAAQRAVIPCPSYAQLQSWRAFGQCTLPMVWRHDSGRKSLILGSTASHIESMDISEGRALLCRLTEWATRPEYVYSHDWREGDLILWDNRICLHRAQPYEIGCGRAATRVALAGEETVPA